MNQKRKPFTNLNSFDDNELAYRSTSEYLRDTYPQNHSMDAFEMIPERSIPRTKTASELATRPTCTKKKRIINHVNYLLSLFFIYVAGRSLSGNPKYKAQEDYYDEIQTLKKVFIFCSNFRRCK